MNIMFIFLIATGILVLIEMLFVKSNNKQRAYSYAVSTGLFLAFSIVTIQILMGPANETWRTIFAAGGLIISIILVIISVKNWIQKRNEP